MRLETLWCWPEQAKLREWSIAASLGPMVVSRLVREWWLWCGGELVRGVEEVESFGGDGFVETEDRMIGDLGAGARAGDFGVEGAV